jgi:hypothetical protein
VIGFAFLLSTAAAQGQISFFAPLTDGCSGVLFEADFNGDGKPDLLCSNLSGGTILLLGNGDGTFATGTPVAGNPLAVADFNGDGKPDILEQGTGTLLVLLGQGDGTFQPAISTPSSATLTVLVAGDLNGDGRADAVGVFNGTLLVYVSKGDGTFAAGVPYSLGGSSPVSKTLAILGDLNGDRKVDVAVITAGDNVPGQIIVFLGNGDGTLQSAKTSAGVYYPSVAVEGDFNGDGKLDLAIAGSVLSGAQAVLLQLGNGDGTFQAPTQAFPGATSFLAAADLNGDGKLDLVVATAVVEIHFGKGDGTFPSIESYHLAPNTYTPGIAVADFNQDGSLDIASGGSLLLANGDGTFQGWPALSLPNIPSGAATGSFDKRAAKDLALTVGYTVGSTPAYAVDILIPNSTGAPVLAHSYTLHQSAGAIATADLNGDGNLDLVAAGNDPTTGEWSYTVLRGNGDGTFRTPLSYPQSVITIAGQIIVADFNNDHKPDIAIALGNQNIAVLLGNGDGTFGPPSYYFDNGAGIIMSADFNGDGNVDLAATVADNSVPTPTAFLFGNGDGTFQPAVFPLGQYAAFSTGDFNNDGKADLLGEGAGLQVLLGNGDGTFNTLPPSWNEPPSLYTPSVQLLADINSDGNLDIIASAFQGVHIDHEGVFPGNGDGTFGPFVDVLDFIDYITPAYVLAAPDMNGDGKPDLVFVDPSINDIFVLLNTTTPGPGVKLSPASISFPSTSVGSSGGPVPVTLTNTGQAALSVTGVSITGSDANQFSQTNNCTSVQPTATCTFNVTFTPTLAGSATANLTITDNASGSPQAVALSGVGTGADMGLGVSSGGSSQTVTAGSTTTYALSIGGKGWSGQTSLTCTGAPTGANCSVTPSSLVVSATGASQLQVSLTTASNTMAEVDPRPSRLSPWLWTLAIMGVVLPSSVRRRRLPVGLRLTSLFTLLLLVSCSSGSSSDHSNNGTPPGTYTLTVAAKAASGSPSQSVMLTLKVQ